MSLSYCTFSGSGFTPLMAFRVQTFEGQIGSDFVPYSDQRFYALADGSISFDLPQGAEFELEAPADANFANPVRAEVPADSTYDIRLLSNIAVSTPPALGGFTVTDGTITFRAGTFKFLGSGFTLVQSPSGVASITAIVGSGIGSIGTIDSQTKSANGAVISGASLVLQAADATHVGLVSTGTQAFAGTKSFDAVQLGPSTQRFIYNGVSTDTAIGEAPVYFTPTFQRVSGSDYRTIGMYIKGSFGTTTGAESLFWTPYNFTLGTSSVPVPLGTKGVLSGYEANIDTAQAAIDAIEGGKAFGATIVTRGGMPMYGSAITLTVQTTAASAIGHNFNLAKNITGGTQYGFYAGSTGSQPGTAGYAVVGAWSYGTDYKAGTYSVGPIRLGNNQAIAARAQNDASDVILFKLNTDNVLEIGVNLLNNISNPYFQAGSWLFQQVDGSRWRLFLANYGEVMSLANGDPTDGTTAMTLLVKKGGVVSLQNVVVGAADSAGTGFRALRIAN